MKKSTFLLSLLLAAGSTSVMAEGYQVNTLSAKQSGMGHVGTGMKLGAESMHFNPAGMAFMDKTLDISAGITGVWGEARYSHDGYNAHTNNSASTPLYGYAGFKIYDFLAAGISLTTPYGNSNKWPDNWKGADLVQEISLKSFSLQPTLAWKITDNFSIGAGLMIMWGDVNISRSLLPMGALSAIAPQYNDVVLASASLHGESSTRVGFNVGAMYDINNEWTIGASYRSKVTAKVTHGKAKMEYANEEIKQLLQKLPTFPQLDKGTFAAELPLPANLTVGGSYNPENSNWLFSADVQWTFWSAYKELNVVFTEVFLDPYSIQADKNYKNSFAFRFGSQYALTDRCDLRCGAYFDMSPVKDNFYNPETPSMNKLGLTLGGSFRPLKHFSIDASVIYLQGFSRDGSYEFVDGLKQPQKFEGHYKSAAFCASIGASYFF